MSEAKTNLVVNSETPFENLDFVIRPPTRVHGERSDEESGSPVGGVRVRVVHGPEHRVTTQTPGFPEPENGKRHRSDSHEYFATTDAAGGFEFFLGDGNYEIMLPSNGRAKKKFTINGQDAIGVDLWTDKKQQLKTEVVIRGQIFEEPSRTPSAFARVDLMIGNEAFQHFGTTDSQGRFEAIVNWPGELRAQNNTAPPALGFVNLRAVNVDGSLSGAIRLNRYFDHVALTIGPSASIIGQLIGPDHDIPWGNSEIQYSEFQVEGRQPSRARDWLGTIKTDEKGMFRIDNLVSGQSYTLSYTGEVSQQMGFNRGGEKLARTVVLAHVIAKEGGDEVNEVRFPPSVGLSIPSVEERLHRLYLSVPNPLQAYRTEIINGGRADQPLIILFGSRENPLVLQIMRARLTSNSRRFDPLKNYRILLVDTDLEQSIELAEELNETVGSQDNDLLIVLLDRNNVKQKTITAGEIFQNDQLSVLRLTRFLQIPLQ